MPSVPAAITVTGLVKRYGDRAVVDGLDLEVQQGEVLAFLGRNGALDHPRCFFVDEPLSGRVGAGLDPCSALQAPILLEPGAQTEVDIFLGEAATREQALALVARYRRTDLDQVLTAVAGHWDGILDVVQVKTPDRAMDLLLNRWLLYQTLACRLVARSAFYQSGGAYGFRDQLQDGMALVMARPELTREHLLRAAEQQFVAVDVQHWWLPHTGRGVRTRIVDDCLWLVHATTHYVDATGDHAVLEVIVPFLEAEALGADEHERYFLPETSEDAGTLFEHCARALDRSMTTGAHGLPLIGTGDWNDGMNRVGAGGRGESVWMAWFLHANLTAMVPLAVARGESTRAAAWQRHAGLLVAAIEQQAWDGKWYRRAYFDDGSPLGSADNDECRIDSIAQSWAVLSGAGDPARARVAMDSVDEHLVRREDGLIRLFTPPFDRSSQDPGYVKSYPPGIRENGGQYTHAAAWVVMAFAKLGDGNRAAQLFSLLNPILRTARPPDLQRYKVEPYVACADVYSSPPLVGRGGWTWYTGSAAWLYRAGLESILGFRVQGEQLLLDPCVPEAWRSFEITYRHRSTRYHLVVENPRGVNRGLTVLALDGVGLPTAPALVPLVDDGSTHEVQVVLG
jgi:cyclic beta-1,2-glucan synthetase